MPLGIILLIVILLLITVLIALMQNAKDKKAGEMAQAKLKMKERADWVVINAKRVNDTCKKNSLMEPVEASTFQSSIGIEEIVYELNKVAEQEGIINSITEESVKKGGGRK